ncbi:hypothetical protein BMJ32_30120 [Sinorhizobium medicae]|nr:hypothetical protein [Sinorhizobium medicae]PLT95389.1 hypothetical protein BMJ32_30120 [Sinorhizobium medicae]PLU55097.1 hypothetical protein BMJ23_18450 [Sinorhizobium medicae]PLU65596.1 hypothetical protein BMJ21_20860 [Sinorhizobium medicae]
MTAELFPPYASVHSSLVKWRGKAVRHRRSFPRTRRRRMQPNGGIQTRNTIERMAETMRSIGEGCTDRDLILTGKFSERQVKLFGQRATELATAMARAA